MRLSTLHAVLAGALISSAGGMASTEPPLLEGAIEGREPAKLPALPKGAVIEKSGFATIVEAPSPPYPEEPPPPENRPSGEAAWYARDVGITEAEAARRQREQQAMRPEFERLLGTLRRYEGSNFTAPRMVHQPDWAYVFYFKRDPERSLAKYTRNRRFKAALARYDQAELDALAKPWIQRFAAARLLGGHGSDPTLGEVMVDLVVSEDEFRQIAAREGWRLPNALKLRFSSPVSGEALPERLRSLVRIFPHSDRALGATNQAALSGRIVLRDGCLYISRGKGADHLAYFPREIGLTLDDAGYLALRNQTPDGRIRGRIGEEFRWAGPLGPVPEGAPMVAELRRQCGSAPLEAISFPESRHNALVRPWVIDEYVRLRRISRQQAWNEIKACWARQDAGKENRHRDCDNPVR